MEARSGQNSANKINQDANIFLHGFIDSKNILCMLIPINFCSYTINFMSHMEYFFVSTRINIL